MTKTIEPASKTDTNLRGYYVGKLNGMTVCCCKGAKATAHNLDYLASLSNHMLSALLRKQ
jgi:hypothetical protein